MIKTHKQYQLSIKRYRSLNFKNLTKADIKEANKLVLEIKEYETRKYAHKPVNTEDLVVMAHWFRGIEESDITPSTMEQVMFGIYGRRGTKKREAAEKRIKELSKSVVERAEEKAFCDEVERLMDEIRIRKLSNIK